MNTTGLELHLRGREVIECEAFERRGKDARGEWANTLTIKYKGYLSGISSGDVSVVITPTANKNKHRFPMIDALGDGYAYEGDPNGARGWRMKIDQIIK